MKIIGRCVILMLSFTAVISGRGFNRNNIRVFPAVNKSIAGVFQVTYLNQLNQPQYAFNASEARNFCLSLGVTMASKTEVQAALSRGLETCRYGWIDEHLSVIPRRHSVSHCGQNKIGLVTWRASVTHKFDVFCFNESDAALQLQDTTTDTPAGSTLILHSTSSSTSHLSSSLSPESLESEAEPARSVSKAKGSSGGNTRKAILIITTCALILVAVIIFIYLKTQRSRLDTKKQEEYIKTEEWTCVKVITEAQEEDEADDESTEDSNDC